MTSKAEGSKRWSFAWDHDNRLTMAWHGKDRVRYRYDALGRRVQRIVPSRGENTKFIYDGDDVLVDDNNGVLTKYINGPGVDNKLKMTTNGTVRYFVSDHLGSTNALTDANGTALPRRWILKKGILRSIGGTNIWSLINNFRTDEMPIRGSTWRISLTADL